MTVQLGTAFSPTWSGRPPHMSPEDRQIWERWRSSSMVGLAERVYFDVGLTTAVAPPGTDLSMSRMWERVTAQRIDVVLEYPKEWFIVELRHDASASAIGRLLSYIMLWGQDPPDKRPVSAILVTDRPAVGLADLSNRHGVKLVVV